MARRPGRTTSSSPVCGRVTSVPSRARSPWSRTASRGRSALVQELYPRDRDGLRGRRDRVARRRQVGARSVRSSATSARSASRSGSSRSTRRARSRRAPCSATGSGSPTTSSTPVSSSARWGPVGTRAASPRRRCSASCSSTPPARTSSSSRPSAPGRRRWRSSAIADEVRARADARRRRLGAGAEGGDHGDPRRDRDQQDGSARREGDAERRPLRALARS